MKRLEFRVIGLLVLSALFMTGASGNTVSFDTSFNGTGYSIQAPVPAPVEAAASSIVIQPDGKILVAGSTFGNDVHQIALMRLNTDGTLDTSFGNGGSVLTSINLAAGGARIRLQPDGKILIGGYSYADQTYDDFAIVRYNTDGSLDTSFNTIGYVTQTIATSLDNVTDLALQPDGKILLLGETLQIPPIFNEQWDIGVMRLNSNGSLDTTFNGTGILSFGASNAWDSARSVIILPDGKILIGGSRRITNKFNFMLMRLNSDGSFDTSFGTGGTTITSVTSQDNFLTTMALQSDGKILAGGGRLVVRYTTNGAVDPSFGINGVATVPGADVGEMTVIGEDEFLIALRGSVVRFLKDGAQDTNFSMPNLNLPNNECFMGSIDVQNDGKILLGGSCSPANITKFAVFRVQETRTKRFLDFNGDGRTDISFFRPSNGQWWHLPFLSVQTQTVVANWGLSTDRPVPADFTGDGRTDVAVFRPSTGDWFVLRSDNNTFYSFTFGTSGDIPVAADYDGDDKADPGVFRPSTGEWYIDKSTGGLMTAAFGTSGDKPVPSDYDGDFKTDIAIYRPSTGEWWINRSSDGGVNGIQFGTSSDSPVQGNYTGDNKTDVALFRPSTGEWFILRSEGGGYFGYPFGLPGDLPVPGNYSGDARYDFAVYRPSENTWHLQLAEGNYLRFIFGTAGDQPLPNLFVP